MLKFVAYLALVACSQAMIECPHNACSVVDCAAVEDCNGRISEGGGWCGCCDVCMTQLADGDSCIQMMLLGTPNTVECAAGLVCNPHTARCSIGAKQSEDTPDTTPCLGKVEEIRKSKQNGLPLFGVMVPTCDDNGDFTAVQCEGSVCFCVDTMGDDIDGYKAGIDGLANMNCRCARDLAAYMKTGLIGRLFYCEANGNYKPEQAPGTTTPKPMAAGSLLTGVLTGTNVAAPGACLTELASVQGSSLLGRFVPECDADGNYTPRQCHGSECYCVRKDGTKIEEYSSPIGMKNHVTCRCARDKDSYLAMGIVGHIHTCRANGNYQQYQCIGSVCYCTDDMGIRLLDQSVSIGNINDLKC